MSKKKKRLTGLLAQKILGAMEKIRNVVAMHAKQKSKKFAHKNARRAKDAKKSWKRDEY